MSTFWALVLLVVVAAIAFWLVDKLKASGTGLPAIAFTIGYIVIVVFALSALYVIAAGALSLPALK